VAFDVQAITSILEDLEIDQVHPITTASFYSDILYLHEAMTLLDEKEKD
jgi:hypothetical protein